MNEDGVGEHILVAQVGRQVAEDHLKRRIILSHPPLVLGDEQGDRARDATRVVGPRSEPERRLVGLVLGCRCQPLDPAGR